jgi:hypothetical protein
MLKRFNQSARLRVCAVAILSVATPLAASAFETTEVRTPCAEFNSERNPYFGDLHVHTTYSADSSLLAGKTTPHDAYAFAKGGVLGLPPFDLLGNPMRSTQLTRPLDFTAVTDHAEFFGEMETCLNQPGLPGYNDPLCQSVRAEAARFGNPATPNTPGDLPPTFVTLLLNLVVPAPARSTAICGNDLADCAALANVIWQDTQAAAEEAYDRSEACTFTSFVGYEWSATTGLANLHRNVIFRNAAVPSVPTSYFEASQAQGLWSALQTGCKDGIPGCDVLVIPHNSNLSNGKMFEPKNANGSAITAADAAVRAAMEPLAEVITADKGSSECRPGVGASDEQCDFESFLGPTAFETDAPQGPFKPLSFVRNAIKEGLRQEDNIGVNPFHFGFIGGTDYHNSNPGDVDETTFGSHGGIAGMDATPAQKLTMISPAGIKLNPGALAVVWAEENSRDALFEAMRRGETYSTSGPRMIVRSFAGRYPEDLCDNPDFVAEGYAKGVPMGGDIGPVRGNFSPRFAIMATMDAGTIEKPGTPLQRIQVVKGWTDPDSGVQEEVYDVAGDANNGAGVDLDTCEETGTGASSLCTVWEDPDFRPDQNAFYYVRVLENPVCRWSKRLCNSLRTCSGSLLACSGNPNRTCTTDAECVAADDGPTCSLPYQPICTNNQDCENIGAGTCGVTPAVDCSSPGATPVAAANCCNSRIPDTIQERATASPIWYHPGLVGITKGSVKFGKTLGEDRLQLGLIIPKAPAELDPVANDLTLTLSDDASVWTATIPAGTMEVKKPGSSYSYKDKTGAIAGITGLKIKISKGSAKISVKTGDIDLSGVAHAAQTLTLTLGAGTYSSTAAGEWDFKDPKLAIKY